LYEPDTAAPSISLEQDYVDRTVYNKNIFSPKRLPQFPGGEAALQTYVAEHWEMQKKERRLISGHTVRVSFSIDTAGKVKSAQTLKNKNGDKINAIALGFITSMPDWIPGGSDSSAVMVADVFLGYYEGKDFSTPARVTLLPRPSIPVCTDPVYLSPDLFELYKMYGNVPDSIFADTIPKLEGGINAYLAKSVRYPIDEKERNIQGTVFMNFIVEKDGSVSHVVAVQNVYGGRGLEKESLRVIIAMPKMTPGTINGKPVRVRMTVPVKYVLL
jgi:hypothetical protein